MLSPCYRHALAKSRFRSSRLSNICRDTSSAVFLRDTVGVTLVTYKLNVTHPQAGQQEELRNVQLGHWFHSLPDPRKGPGSAKLRLAA